MNGHIVMSVNEVVYMLRPERIPRGWPRAKVTPLCWRRIPIRDPMAIGRLVTKK